MSTNTKTEPSHQNDTEDVEVIEVKYSGTHSSSSSFCSERPAERGHQKALDLERDNIRLNSELLSSANADKDYFKKEVRELKRDREELNQQNRELREKNETLNTKTQEMQCKIHEMEIKELKGRSHVNETKVEMKKLFKFYGKIKFQRLEEELDEAKETLKRSATVNC